MDSLNPADVKHVETFSLPSTQDPQLINQDQLGTAAKVDDLMSALSEVFEDIEAITDTKESTEQLIVSKSEKIEESTTAAEAIKDVYRFVKDLKGDYTLMNWLDLATQYLAEDLGHMLQADGFDGRMQGTTFFVPSRCEFEKGSKQTFVVNGQSKEYTIDHMSEQEELELFSLIERFIEDVRQSELKNRAQEKEQPEISHAPRQKEKTQTNSNKAPEQEKEPIKELLPFTFILKGRVKNSSASEERAAQESEKKKLEIFLDKLWLQLQKDILKHEVSSQQLKQEHEIFQILHSWLKT